MELSIIELLERLDGNGITITDKEKISYVLSLYGLYEGTVINHDPDDCG